MKTMMMLSNKVADPADKLEQVTVVDDSVRSPGPSLRTWPRRFSTCSTATPLRHLQL